jgi:hypothetical protein
MKKTTKNKNLKATTGILIKGRRVGSVADIMHP